MADIGKPREIITIEPIEVPAEKPAKVPEKVPA
jgi:hypothetical protein